MRDAEIRQILACPLFPKECEFRFNYGSPKQQLKTLRNWFVSGAAFGLWHWAVSICSGIPASAGTVVLAALPIIVGVQMLLSWLNLDVAAEPRLPVHTLLGEQHASIQGILPTPSLSDSMEHAMTSTSVILYATFTARAGHAGTVASLLADYAATVRAEAGNVLFEASSRVGAPEAFFVYEEYVDDAAFQAHLGAPYGARFNAALAPLIVEPQSQLVFLKRVVG